MEDDPWAASIVKFCEPSFSQEELLRRVPLTDFPLESPESADFPPEPSTGIMIVSPPESSQERDGIPHEDFRTPPEEAMAQLVSSEEQRPMMAVTGIGGRNNTEEDSVFVDAGSDCDATADLGNDSELSAVRLIRGFTCEGKEIRVSKAPNLCAELVAKSSRDADEVERTVDLGKDSESGFSKENKAEAPTSENEISGESPLKKLRLSHKNLRLDSRNVGAMENNEAATESVQIGEKNELPNPETNEERNLGSGDTEALESEFEDGEGIRMVDSMAVKGSDESVKPVETVREDDEMDELHSAGNRYSLARNTDDIENGKCACSTSKGVEGKSDRPLSPGGQSANTQRGSSCGTEQWLRTIQKFLGMLSKNRGERSLANESILEIAQQRGMRFPQPRSLHGPGGGYSPGLS